jgi:hypothetical protein
MSVCAPIAAEQTVRHVVVKVAADGTMTCLPDELDVSGANVLIAFRLDGNGWVFPDSGAVVVSGGGSQFPIPSWTVNPKLAALLDCDTATGSFSYTVTVQDSTSGRRMHLDPTIKNGT